MFRLVVASIQQSHFSLLFLEYMQTQLKETFANFPFNPDSPRIKICQSYLLLQEGKITEFDSLLKVAMKILINQWNSLPKTPGIAHVPLLEVILSFCFFLVNKSSNKYSFSFFSALVF